MKKMLSMILALAMVFALCAAASAELKTVQDGKLVMATSAAFPPYEYYSDEESDKIIGIDAEIAGLIAEKLGLELVIEDIEFASIISGVQQGKFDMGMAGMTVTEERKKNVDFSTNYAKGVQAIIVPEGSEIKTADDLPGHMIGVQESTTGHIYCEGDFGAENVTAYSTGAFAVEALKKGKVDCVVTDNNPAKAYVSVNEGLVILDSAYTEEDYAIATSKNNPDLTKAIDEALKELIEDGSVQEVLDKYISAE